MKIFIDTEKFILREILETDVEGMYALDSDPEVHKYLGNNPIASMDAALATIQHVRKQYKENGIGRWAIIDKASNEFVGWAGLKYEQNLRTNFNYYDIGYRLLRKYWGKGIASEAAKVSLEYGFNQLNINEIFAAAHVGNAASNKILTNIGLKFIDTFEYNGALTNWYGLNKSEYLLTH
jgi:[ribosomal protein S5]-alanine N-acetyltransferase